jgi:PKD repeat protein
MRLLAGAAAALILSSACGGDGGTPPDENDPPVAAFTAPTNCVAGTACAFSADGSSDDVAVTGWNWNFDADLTTSEGNAATASYTFPAAGTVDVRLIVSDAAGLADTVNHPVIVAPTTPGNTAPVSSFTLPVDCVADTPCGFTSTSTDPDGAEDITGWSWDFGDGTTFGEGANVTHTYNEAGTYPVVLTVTDVGGLTHSSTQQLTVTAAAATDCTTTGTIVTCSLVMTQQVNVKITVAGENCELSGNKLEVTVPRVQTAFFNLCNQPAGAEYIVNNGDGPPATPTVFLAGSTLTLRFTQGPPPASPPTGDPGIQVTGSYPSWTLNVDDGGAAGTSGEPDFNDVALTVTATAAP